MLSLGIVSGLIVYTVWCVCVMPSVYLRLELIYSALLTYLFINKSKHI